jgi:hypothetical protein
MIDHGPSRTSSDISGRLHPKFTKALSVVMMAGVSVLILLTAAALGAAVLTPQEPDLLGVIEKEPAAPEGSGDEADGPEDPTQEEGLPEEEEDGRREDVDEQYSGYDDDYDDYELWDDWCGTSYLMPMDFHWSQPGLFEAIGPSNVSAPFAFPFEDPEQEAELGPHRHLTAVTWMPDGGKLEKIHLKAEPEGAWLTIWFEEGLDEGPLIENLTVLLERTGVPDNDPQVILQEIKRSARPSSDPGIVIANALVHTPSNLTGLFQDLGRPYHAPAPDPHHHGHWEYGFQAGWWTQDLPDPYYDETATLRVYADDQVTVWIPYGYAKDQTAREEWTKRFFEHNELPQPDFSTKE